MKRNTVTSLLLVLGALVLAACSPGGEGPGLPERTALTPRGDVTAAHSSSISIGQTHHFSLDASAVEGDLLVIELDQNLRLERTSVSGANVTMVSTGPDSFGAQEVTVNAAAVGPQAIGVDPVPCRASCIVLPATDDTVLLQVRGATLPTGYSVFVYGAPYVDLNELVGNDSALLPPGYFLGEEDGGAIETLNDVDYWLVTATDLGAEEVEFFAPGDIGAVLSVIGLDSVERGPFVSGDVVSVVPGELLRVSSETQQAARGVTGYYYLSPLEVVPLDREDAG